MPRRPKRALDALKLECGLLDLNSSLLQEQYVLLTAESPLADFIFLRLSSNFQIELTAGEVNVLFRCLLSIKCLLKRND